MKLCHTCNNNDMSFSTTCDPREAQWIKREKLEPVPVKINPKDCRIQHPKNADIEITITQNEIKPGKKILYWAAYGKSLGKAHEITSALYAYKREGNHKFKNYGCTKVRKDGKIVIKIESPQCYKEKNTLWPRHLHFVEENEDNTWRKENFFTVSGLPIETDNVKTNKIKSGNVYVSPGQVRKNWKKGNFYMVYALSKKYPSLVGIEKYKNYKHLQIDHETKKLNLPKEIKPETPMVVYCAKRSCNAAKKLILKLSKSGYQNLFYMEEGMTEFSEESLNLFKNNINDKNIKTYSKMF